jgi:hypothetical protein
MTIGNVLIRPQVLDRRPSDDEAAALDMLTGLGTRLIADFMSGGPASKKIATAIEAGAQQFIGQFESRLQSGGSKILDWAKPYMSIIEGITHNLGNDTAANLIAVATALVTLTEKILEDLHSANIAARLNELADILEEDLGIKWSIFEDFFDSLFESATTTLSTDFLNGDQSEEALNNFLIARQLLSLRHFAKNQLEALPLPAFNRRELIREWQLELEASNWDETLDKIQDKLKAGPERLTKVLPLLTTGLSFNVSASASISSREFRDTPKPGQYAWYASWFLEEGTGVKDRFNLSGESFAGQIHFTDALSEKFLENWALITAALEEAARAVKYGFDLDNGNRVSPALNLAWQSSMGVMTLLSYLVDGEEWVDFYTVKNNTAFNLGVPGLLSFAGSFEQFPGFWGWLWATMPHDFSNMTDGRSWPQLIREGLLSLFTLINADKDPNTKNHEKVNGITAASHTGGTYIASLIMGRRERYYSVFSDSFGISVLVILGGGAITWAFDIIGWLISGAIARRLSDRYWKFESDKFTSGVAEFFGSDNAYGALFWSFIDFYLTWGDFWDGRTNDGKFGLKQKLLPDGTFEKVDATFNGYAPKASSPYKLPFAPGRLVFCSQGYHGFSGHNYRKSLLYAADFLLNEGELALAMRDGTVVDFVDDRPNGSDLGFNYIVIRHDTVDPVHDFGESGVVTSTYARYENASPFGIRQAFAMMGIPESRILGIKVQQGFPLIRMGKRPGFFNFDHLQVQVTGGASDGILPTIPFVFRDLPDKGVPEKGKYYGSGNTSKASTTLSQLHPGEATGFVLDSGVDFVKLQTTASDSDDFYNGSHILVWYDLNGKEPWYEYQKIKAYKGDDRKITIDGNWLAGYPPPADARYRIGGRLYSKADTFDKHFAYLANRDGGGTAQPFADGHPVYALGQTGYFQVALVSGRLMGGGVKGTSKIHLDAANTNGIEYRFRHLKISRAGQIIQYLLIRDWRFDAGVLKVTIDGVLEIDLQIAGTPDTYEIGGLPYWQPSVPKGLAYLVPDRSLDQYAPNKFTDNQDPFRYHTVGIS